MPEGYWIVSGDVNDPEGYRAYVAQRLLNPTADPVPDHQAGELRTIDENDLPAEHFCGLANRW